MATMLEWIAGQQIQQFEPGCNLIEQGARNSPLLILIEGEVEILRDEVRVAKSSEPGAVFGEMSVLLGTPTTATVRALKASTFAVVYDPRKFLESSPQISLHVAKLLASRVDALNKYLVDVKRQYEGHDHLSMVDEVLETLMHRQPRSNRQ